MQYLKVGDLIKQYDDYGDITRLVYVGYVKRITDKWTTITFVVQHGKPAQHQWKTKNVIAHLNSGFWKLQKCQK